MKQILIILAFVCLFALPSGAAALPKEHFIIHYVEPTPEATISQEELDAWADASKDFAKAEERLLDAYQDALDDFGPGGESWLMMNQGDWAKRRQADALERHGPKGSPAYISFLITEADKRSAWLDQLAEKGKVIFAHNYLYEQSGYEGMVILYYRKRGMEFELFTTNLETGAVCEAYGEGNPSEGKTQYKSFAIEFVDLGKALLLTAPSEAPLCQDGGRFTGTYVLTK